MYDESIVRVLPDRGSHRRDRVSGTREVVDRCGIRHKRVRVGATVLSALVVVIFTFGTGGVASATIAPPMQPTGTTTFAQDYSCLGWLGWGIVQVGATAATDGWWVVVGGISTGQAAYAANNACSNDAEQHVGYRALCSGQHFMYVSPVSGKKVYDNRSGACSSNPYTDDSVLCNYLRPPGYSDVCYWQGITDAIQQNELWAGSAHYYWRGPYDGAAGGGGGGSW